MKKHVIGIFLCMLMISSVLASATVNTSKEANLFDIKDGTISVTIPVGEYDIDSTNEGDEIYVENFGRLLIPGKPNMPSKIFYANLKQEKNRMVRAF